MQQWKIKSLNILLSKSLCIEKLFFWEGGGEFNLDFCDLFLQLFQNQTSNSSVLNRLKKDYCKILSVSRTLILLISNFFLFYFILFVWPKTSHRKKKNYQVF